MQAIKRDEANVSGDALERFIRSTLASKKIQYTAQFTTRDIGQFQEAIKVDVFVHDGQLSGYMDGLYIQCKRQSVGGTCDQKVAYLCEQIQTCCSRPTIVVVDGKEAERIFKYLRSRQGGQLRAVLWKEQVEDWISNLARTSANNGYLF